LVLRLRKGFRKAHYFYSRELDSFLIGDLHDHDRGLIETEARRGRNKPRTQIEDPLASSTVSIRRRKKSEKRKGRKRDHCQSACSRRHLPRRYAKKGERTGSREPKSQGKVERNLKGDTAAAALRLKVTFI